MVLKSDYSKERTEVKMAQDAMDAQAACNLTALAQSLARHTQVLLKQGHGTDWVNQHPVIILIVWQMSHLSIGSCPHDNDGRWSWAYEFCSEVATRKE